MILNGIPIKKYKAKVRNIIPITTSNEPINTDEYRITVIHFKKKISNEKRRNLI